jgi:hypothetical protein
MAIAKQIKSLTSECNFSNTDADLFCDEDIKEIFSEI